jgi:hypothetical protein
MGNARVQVKQESKDDTMRRALLFGAAALLVGLGATTGVIRAQSAGQPVRQPIGNGTASLDVFAQGATLDLLTTERDGSDLELRHQRSTDGGETWGPVHVIDTADQPISIASRGNEPQVVAHGDHVAVHWSTTGTARFGAGPMVTAISDDAGRFWRTGPNPADDDSGGAQNFADMTADPDGVFYVAWIGSHDGPAGRGLGVARSTDFGETWEHSQLADASSCACCWNKMIATRAGEVRVLYRDHGIRDMALASTDDAGAHWSLDGAVGAFNWEFPGCPHVGGGIAAAQDDEGAEQLHALVWTGHEVRHGLYWVRSADDGATWTEPRRMGGELARHADLGAAGQTVVAAWDETRVIRVSISHDLGDHWSAARQVSADGMVASHPIVIHTGESFRLFWTERDQAGLMHWRSQRLGGDHSTATTGGQGAP